MTDREQAIKDLEDIIATAEGIKGLSDDAGITISLDKIDSLKTALSDMEKQIPKKPKPINWEQYIGVVRNAEYLRNKSWCPNCGTDIQCGRYCNSCGQALDWSDEE